MGLIDKLRKAEEQGKYAARQAFERAKHFSEDAERRIRQKMRIYPPSPGESQPGKNGASGAHRKENGMPERAPIISIRGEDVESDKVA
jgi:hypothetical protein